MSLTINRSSRPSPTTSTQRNTPARPTSTSATPRRKQLFTRDEFVPAGAGARATTATQQKNGPLTPAQTNALKKELTRVYERDFKTHLTGSFAYRTAVEHLQQKLIARGEKIEKDGLLGRGTYNAMVRQYGRQAADEISRHMMKMNRGGEETC